MRISSTDAKTFSQYLQRDLRRLDVEISQANVQRIACEQQIRAMQDKIIELRALEAACEEARAIIALRIDALTTETGAEVTA